MCFNYSSDTKCIHAEHGIRVIVMFLRTFLCFNERSNNKWIGDVQVMNVTLHFLSNILCFKKRLILHEHTYKKCHPNLHIELFVFKHVGNIKATFFALMKVVII